MKLLMNVVFTLVCSLSLFVNRDSFICFIASSNELADRITSIFPARINTYIILFVIFLLFNEEKLKIRSKTRINKYSLFFSVVMYIGLACKSQGSIFFQGNSLIMSLLYYSFSILYVIGWYVICDNAIYYFDIYNNFVDKQHIKTSTKKIYILSSLLILACWSPYIFFRLPAGVSPDSEVQISMALGYTELTASNPLLSTMLIKCFINVGQIVFNSMDAGLTLYVVVQSIISSSILSLSIVCISKESNNKHLALFALLNYCLNPLFPGYLTSIVKDAPYTIFILLLIILLILYYDNSSIKLLVGICISLLFVCLFRTNGIVIGLFLFIFLIIKSIKNKMFSDRLLIAPIGMVCLISIIFQFVIVPNYGIRNDRPVDQYSSMFQQTARYYVNYSDQMTEEELDILGKNFELNKIKESYNYGLVNPMKRIYIGNKNTLPEYIKLWGKLFLKHPLLYVDSIISNTYGFIYPNNEYFTLQSYTYPTYSIDNTFYIDKNICELFRSVVKVIEYNPLTFIFSNIGLIGCIGLAIVVSIIKNNNRFIIQLTPIIATYLCCLLSPTWEYDGIRYFLPILVSFPILICIYVITVINNNDCKNKQ